MPVQEGGNLLPVKGGYKDIQREIKHLDISNVPELLRIAEEVRITHQPRILRRDSEDLAMRIFTKAADFPRSLLSNYEIPG